MEKNIKHPMCILSVSMDKRVYKGICGIVKKIKK